ncbi:sulfotransferase [Pseudoruegeria sp. SHC-113]|uniref:sulfotransferase n=1 Tax=Pseudoruegeria sp. SHC-113 TaxID=2855439 RepID=UPI0021BB1A2E|nr:sulfotransferase [Pseudoruegeria sp. SHC-113]MCT8161273.1 sulfotransferase [Pseudoruegeria sp. SHC-113]
MTASALPSFKVMGERNSGTNLLHKMLASQFDVLVHPTSSGVSDRQKSILPRFASRWSSPRAAKEAVQDHNHFAELPENGGWKHAAASERLWDEFADPRNVTLIFLLRHPVSWSQSMHQNPFHGLARVPRAYAEFIRAPWLTVARDGFDQRIFETPLHLLRAKVESYLAFAEAHPNACVLRYEDLVLDPEAAFRKIGVWDARKVEPPGLPAQSARTFGRNPLSREGYIAKAQATGYHSLSQADRDHFQSALTGSPLLALYPFDTA